MEILLTLITNRQYHLLDVLLFCAFAVLINQSQYAVAICTLIVGSIINALISLRANKL